MCVIYLLFAYLHFQIKMFCNLYTKVPFVHITLTLLVNMNELWTIFMQHLFVLISTFTNTFLNLKLYLLTLMLNVN